MRVVLVLACIGCGRLNFSPLPDSALQDSALQDSATTPSSCFTQLTGGAYHACALRGDGTVDCWGRDLDGELGDGQFTSSPVPVPVTMLDGTRLSGVTQISAGVEHSTCARTSDGHVWCWGLNSIYQLGDGTMNSQGHPVEVQRAAGTPLTGIRQIAMGEVSACAVLDDQTIVCWGQNFYGELGNPAAGNPSPYPVSVVDQTSTPLTNVVGATVAVSHGCAWLSSGGASCWGDNMFGELADGTMTKQPAAVPVQLSGISVASSSYLTSCFLVSGQPYCAGDNSGGALGDGTFTNRPIPVPVLAEGGLPLTNVAEIAIGDFHGCARRSSGDIWCWGSNALGQLGRISATSEFALQVPLPARARMLVAANEFNCAGLEDDTIACWGSGTYGELGNGQFMTSSAAVITSLACP